MAQRLFIVAGHFFFTSAGPVLRTGPVTLGMAASGHVKPFRGVLCVSGNPPKRSFTSFTPPAKSAFGL